MATTTYLRTSVILDKNTIDLQLPAESPVEDVTFELIRDLHRILTERGMDTEWLEDEDAVWSLERFGRRQLDGEKSLAEHGVTDGDRLWLTKNAKNETYPALIDDIAESVAKYQEKFPEWSYEMDATRFASILLGVLPIGVLFGLVYLVGWGLHEHVPYRWAFVAFSAVMTLLASTNAIILSKGDGLATLRVAMTATGYAGVGATAFIALPRDPSIWHLPMMSGCLLVYAVIILPLTRRPIKLHAAIITTAATVLIVSSINFLYASSPTVVGIQVATVAYLIILFSSKPAMLAGRVETPYVPAAGEAFTKGETSVTDISRSSSSGEVIESVVNQQKQNHAAHEYLLGILVGGLISVIGGIAFAAMFLKNRDITVFFVDINEMWLVALYVISMAVAMANRARNYIDRDTHLLMMSASVVTVVTYVGVLAFTNSEANLKQITVTVALFAVAALVGSLWALGQKEIRSPITRRWLELAENMAYALPVLWLGWLMNVYMIVRNR